VRRAQRRRQFLLIERQKSVMNRRAELEPQRRAMATEARAQLLQALKAHISELEIERDLASDRDLEALDRRIGAARLLLEWLSKALEPEPAASTAQTPPPPGPQADPEKSPTPNPASRKSCRPQLAIRPTRRGLVQTKQASCRWPLTPKSGRLSARRLRARRSEY
jgi:hypothetical protein